MAVVIAVLAVVLLAALFWNRSAAPRAEDGRLRVATTFLPLYSLTAAIAGEDALVENLLPPGVGPHEYAFAPSDIERLSRADVLVANGLGLEEWLADVVATANPDIAVVEASAGITTRTPLEAIRLGEEEEDEEEHGPADPHVWLDPVRAKAMAGNIAVALSAADPDNAAGYRSRLAVLEGRLDALDRDIRETLAPLPDKRFVAFHDAFGYFAERYGLETVAVVEASPGKEPSPADVARIVTLIRAERVKAIFSEPQFSPRIVETIAAETGLVTHPLDPLETGDFTADAYERGMRANLASFAAALRGTP